MPNATNLGSLLVRAVAMEKISWLLLFAIPQVSPQIPSRYLSNMMLELQISICHQLVRLFVQFISSYPNTPMHIIYIFKKYIHGVSGPTLPGAGPSLRRWMRDVSYGVGDLNASNLECHSWKPLETFQILVKPCKIQRLKHHCNLH